MSRRLGLVIALTVGLVLAALVFFRAAILQAVIQERLRAYGVADGTLQITAVGLRETRIADLRLGADDELEAGELRILYRPGDLLQGRIEAIAIDGLVLRLDLTGGAPPLGSLQPFAAGGGGGAPARLPAITFSNSRIEAQTPLGAITGHIEGEAWSEAPGTSAAVVSFDLAGGQGRLRGAFDVARAPDGTVTGNLVLEDGTLALPGAELAGLAGEAAFTLAQGRPPTLAADVSAGRITLPDAAFEEARLTLRTEDTRASLAGRMRGADGRWSLALEGTLDDYLAAPEVRFDLTARAAAGAALWPPLALRDPAEGQARVRLNAGGRLPPLKELGEDGSTPAEWLERATLEGRLAVEVEGLGYPGRAEGVSGNVRIDGALKAGTLSFRMPRAARLEAADLESNWLREIGLPEPAVALLRDGAAIAMRVDGEAAKTRLTSTGVIQLSTPGGAELEVETKARLDFGEAFELVGLALDDLRFAARAIPLPGVRLREFQAAGTLAGPPGALAGELHMTAEAEDAAIGALRAAKATASLSAAIRAEPRSFSLQLPPGETPLPERRCLAAMQKSQGLPAAR